MDDELIGEVDDQDRLIGPRRRGDVHRLGLRHRSVHVLVFNLQGEVFLQKRSLSKDVSPGCWDTSAAGHVDYGESYERSASRELEEELGITASELRALGKIAASAATGWEFVAVYRVEYGGELRLNADEIEAGRWFSTAEIEAWIAAGGQGLTRAFQSVWALARGV